MNHPADFYVLEPRQDHLRLSQATPIAGLSLAGDYTAQKYLGTKEGAVVSGILAAENVTNGVQNTQTHVTEPS